MDVYDYAEDYVSGGDPDFTTFLMICEARRDYSGSPEWRHLH